MRSGGDVKVIDVGEPLWVEIDNPEELRAAERMVAKDPSGYL